MAQSESIRDAAESVVNALRSTLSPHLVAPDRVRLVSREELKEFPEAGRAAVTVHVHRATLRHMLMSAERESAVPIELSLVVTPWADDHAWELVLLGHSMTAVERHPMIRPPVRTGSSWRDDDVLQLVDAGLTDEQAVQVFLGLGLPSRASLFLKVQVFALEVGSPSAEETPQDPS